MKRYHRGCKGELAWEEKNPLSLRCTECGELIALQEGLPDAELEVLLIEGGVGSKPEQRPPRVIHAKCGGQLRIRDECELECTRCAGTLSIFAHADVVWLPPENQLPFFFPHPLSGAVYTYDAALNVEER